MTTGRIMKFTIRQKMLKASREKMKRAVKMVEPCARRVAYLPEI
jgi:hypothetical protein